MKRNKFIVAANHKGHQYVIIYLEGQEKEALKTILDWAWNRTVKLPPKMATDMARKVQLYKRKETPRR